jgi:predicted kinase
MHISKVIIVFGLPGSGKSYFASRFAGLTGAVYINSDRFRNQLYTRKTYAEKEKLSVYAKMLEAAKKALQQNKDIVIDGTFYKKNIRRKFLGVIQGKACLAFIEVCAEETIIEKRLTQKRADSDAGFEVFKIIKKQWEHMPEEHLLLDSGKDTIDAMLQAATWYVNQKCP